MILCCCVRVQTDDHQNGKRARDDERSCRVLGGFAGPVIIKPAHRLIEATHSDVRSGAKGAELLRIAENAIRHRGIIHDPRCRLVGVSAGDEGIDLNHEIDMRSYDRAVNGHLTATAFGMRRQNDRMTMKDILKRISDRSAQLGLTDNALSLRAGLSRDGIRNWRRRTEGGEEAGATVTALAGVASALGVSETWLIHGIGEGPDRPSIAVAGQVGAGAAVPLVDAYAKGDGLFRVAAPAQLLRHGPPRGIVAVEVEGDSMVPMYQPGDVLFYTRATHEGIPEEDIGRPCIVEDAEGNAWVKQVKRGDEPGLFHLISLNPTSETRHNQRIKWAARVRLALPAEMVERL